MPIDPLGQYLGQEEMLSFGKVVLDHLAESLDENWVVLVKCQFIFTDTIIVDKIDSHLVFWKRLERRRLCTRLHNRLIWIGLRIILFDKLVGTPSYFSKFTTHYVDYDLYCEWLTIVFVF